MVLETIFFGIGVIIGLVLFTATIGAVVFGAFFGIPLLLGALS